MNADEDAYRRLSAFIGGPNDLFTAFQGAV
jgi:hypothetical protein